LILPAGWSARLYGITSFAADGNEFAWIEEHISLAGNK